MAYLFEVAAELGQDPAHAEGLRPFDKVAWALSDTTVVGCVLDTGPSTLWRGPDQNWWCRVVPKGVSVTGGARSVDRDSMLVEVAHHMYETLRKCFGFRF